MSRDIADRIKELEDRVSKLEARIDAKDALIDRLVKAVNAVLSDKQMDQIHRTYG